MRTLATPSDLNFAKKIYDLAQKALSDSGASSTSDSLYIYRAALADLEKKINNAGAKWAGIDEGKAEMKKVHHAEKELDKAKRRLEAVRKGRRKKAASNPKIVAFFLLTRWNTIVKTVAV